MVRVLVLPRIRGLLQCEYASMTAVVMEFVLLLQAGHTVPVTLASAGLLVINSYLRTTQALPL